jgi:hypothetical protein
MPLKHHTKHRSIVCNVTHNLNILKLTILTLNILKWIWLGEGLKISQKHKFDSSPDCSGTPHPIFYWGGVQRKAGTI